MRKEFISGYIALAEGEKDPRNLLTAFAIARVILIEFDITDHVEVCLLFVAGNGDVSFLTYFTRQALFNITFCYFPISFRPPPNDPYGIGADDLKIALG
jgi:DNA repair/transcription protein MET18/MMS19